MSEILPKSSDLHWEPVTPAATARILSDARSSETAADLCLGNDLIHSRFLPIVRGDALLFDTRLRVAANRLPRRDERITVQWLRKRDGHHYQFQALATGVLPYEDGLPAIGVAVPKTLERTQRRHAFRVPIPLEDAQDLSVQWNGTSGRFGFPAFAHDLSVDGMRLSFVLPLSFSETPLKGLRLELTLHLNRETFTVDADVVRVEKTGTPEDHASGRERFTLGVHFVEPFALFLAALETYIADRQRKTLRERP